MLVLGAKKPNQIKEFMGAILEPMSRCNNDGVGYTAINKDGEMFTERWLKNKEGLKGDPTDTREQGIKKDLGSLVEIEKKEEKEYTVQGEYKWSNVTSVIMHTRFATCGKGIDNVHPFVDNENVTSIAHNGVIRNDQEFKKLNSTCDSEVILTEYNKLGIGKDHTQITKLVDNLEGYWAVGATTLDANGKRIIDVFTSNAPPNSGALVVAYVKELDGYVLCSTGSTIDETIKNLKWEPVTTYSINPHVFTRFNAATGKKICQLSYEKNMVDFKVTGKGYGQTKNYSIGKTKNNRRSLPQTQGTKEATGSKSTGTGQDGNKSVDVLMCPAIGYVSSFYNGGNRKTNTQLFGKDTDVEGIGLSKNDKDALAHYEHSKMDNHPNNFSKLKQVDDFSNSLENFLEANTSSSDSKYPSKVLDADLTDEELDELDKLEKELTEKDKDIVSQLSTDMKYCFLNGMVKKEA